MYSRNTNHIEKERDEREDGGDRRGHKAKKKKQTFRTFRDGSHAGQGNVYFSTAREDHNGARPATVHKQGNSRKGGEGNMFRSSALLTARSHSRSSNAVN